MVSLQKGSKCGYTRNPDFITKYIHRQKWHTLAHYHQYLLKYPQASHPPTCFKDLFCLAS